MNFINKNSGVVAVIALIIAIVAIFVAVNKPVVVNVASQQAAPSFGGVTNYDELTLQETKSATTSLEIYGGTGDTTHGGCIELNATSTNTKLNLRFSPLGATSTFNGTVYFAYGTCE